MALEEAPAGSLVSEMDGRMAHLGTPTPDRRQIRGSRPSVQPLADSLEAIEAVAPRGDPAKLARDIEALPLLQLEGFDGPVWQRRGEELVAYGMATLPKKIRTGEIFALMAKAGQPQAEDLVLPRGGVDRQEARDLAADTCMAALPRFRERSS